MASDGYPSSPPQYGRIPRLRGFLPLNNENPGPLPARSVGALNSLIKTTRSSALSPVKPRQGSFLGRATPDDEEAVRTSYDSDREDLTRNDDRGHMLHREEMRSQRLIGNSNPRYRWERYWKTEEE